jgi:hypothetical protein
MSIFFAQVHLFLHVLIDAHVFTRLRWLLSRACALHELFETRDFENDFSMFSSQARKNVLKTLVLFKFCLKIKGAP